MSSQKLNNDSYCLGQKHYSGTTNFLAEITCNKKTSREIKKLFGECLICNK